MKASITRLLNEAVPDTIFAFVPKLTTEYGLGMPPRKNEDPFVTWCKLFVRETPSMNPGLAKALIKNPGQAVDILIRELGATFVLAIGGEVSVFSSRRNPRLPQGFRDKLLKMGGLKPNDPVGWFQNLDATPVELTADEVLYGGPPAQKSTLDNPALKKNMDRHDIANLRRKFWGGQADPGLSADIVDKLLGK